MSTADIVGDKFNAFIDEQTLKIVRRHDDAVREFDGKEAELIVKMVDAATTIGEAAAADVTAIIDRVLAFCFDHQGTLTRNPDISEPILLIFCT